ncbi:hypothetical protein L3X38_017133 [Prunus dulcis]|uniref:Uncharacterized protein n=1 Tax=Prunus dulcis TaxID=3755 RepID=A0AAD4W971_PRUDU|nr:hypothetical protein L3X38_017133 [Prunus dulcis]
MSSFPLRFGPTTCLRARELEHYAMESRNFSKMARGSCVRLTDRSWSRSTGESLVGWTKDTQRVELHLWHEELGRRQERARISPKTHRSESPGSIGSGDVARRFRGLESHLAATANSSCAGDFRTKD